MTGAVWLTNHMVQRLHTEAKRYFSGWRKVNYEDMFYLAKQASDDEMGEMENPAVRAFVDKLRAEFSPSIEAAKARNDDPNEPRVPDIPGDFKTLLNQTCNYISDIVWQSLCREPKSTDHLNIFIDACRSGCVTGISTLCHDTHGETFFRAKGIALSDGFDENAENGVRYWNSDLSSEGKTPFLKLHGSVDWFDLCPDSSESAFDVQIGIPHGDFEHTKTADGVLQLPCDGRPLLLIGTFNKSTRYSVGIFKDIHCRFRSLLSKSDKLIVCGYSFGDKGINSEIFDWYYAKRGRRFLIIHPDPDELVSNARGAIRNNWGEWEKRGSIKVIPKPLECVGAAEFKEAISL